MLIIKEKSQKEKPKMSVINAVRFTLLARVVAVVNNDKMYVKKVA